MFARLLKTETELARQLAAGDPGGAGFAAVTAKYSDRPAGLCTCSSATIRASELYGPQQGGKAGQRKNLGHPARTPERLPVDERPIGRGAGHVEGR